MKYNGAWRQSAATADVAGMRHGAASPAGVLCRVAVQPWLHVELSWLASSLQNREVDRLDSTFIEGRTS
jgi:hypothetical protein